MQRNEELLEYIRMAEKIIIKQYVTNNYAGGIGGYPPGGRVELVRSIDEVLMAAEKIRQWCEPTTKRLIIKHKVRK